MKSKLIFRQALKDDVLAIVEMVWKDNLRQLDRPHPSMELDHYHEYFEKISNDENQYLLVVENYSGQIVATCHLTHLYYLPFFDHRLLVEYVRVDETLKGQGVGRQMFEWIESKAREWDVHLIQLTTDARRADAQSFYKALGYKPTHVGMKLLLE
jgi:GNAT superfamily N-acetyltransferase